MSSGWSWFIIIFTILNVIAMWWLAAANSKRKPDEPEASETMGHVWDGDLQEYNQPLPLWWLMLFYITIVFGVGYLVLYPGLGNYQGLLGWTQTGQYETELKQARNRYSEIYDRLGAMSIEDLTGDEQAQNIGHSLFVNNCSVCHGSDGRGAPTFPNLADNDWLYGNDPDVVLTSIINGRNGVMPPLGAALGGDEGINNVVQYVLSLSGQTHDAKAAAAGKNKFAVCAACHGMDGTGNTLLGAPNLTDNIWLYGSSAADIRDGIINGRNNRMPAQGEQLGEERARILASYVLNLSRDATP